ncbi:MAG: hypothetical protein IH963_12510, partial [Chloroflexi bacterium]|nr:hypothetical protein [Chloroflexota bacterium]
TQQLLLGKNDDITQLDIAQLALLDEFAVVDVDNSSASLVDTLPTEAHALLHIAVPDAKVTLEVPITQEHMLGFLDEMMDEKAKEEFLESGDADLALSMPGIGRFRVNCLMQRSTVAIIMRRRSHGMVWTVSSRYTVGEGEHVIIPPSGRGNQTGARIAVIDISPVPASAQRRSPWWDNAQR